jgi:penicillin-binding protein 2
LYFCHFAPYFKLKKSRIKYFAPNGRVVERLKLYGVNPKNIFLTGFPLPKELIGGPEGEIIKKDLIGRLCNLDPNGIFVHKYWRTLEAELGSGTCPLKPNHPLTLTFAIGGAGAQKSLAWNEENPGQSKFLLRKYFPSAGFSHILGYVKYPKKDTKGYFWRTEYTGLDGVEKQFNDVLSGVNGARIIETSVSGEEVSSNIYEAPVSGENVTLSIDSEIQGYFYDAIKQVSDNSNYIGGSGMLVDLKTGEVLSLVNYPEYDSNIMTESRNEEVISGYFQNTHYPLLNRAISGIYTPGSIVKPFVGIGALVEGVITPSTRIASISFF